MALTLQDAAQKMFGAAGATFDPAIGGPWVAALAHPGLFFAHDVCQDFIRLPNTTDDIVETSDGTLAIVVDAVVGGVLSIPTTAATDNHEAYVSALKANYLFASGKPQYFEARVKLTEANTDDANIIIGLSDTFGANFLLDNGAGAAASYDGAAWVKVDGGTVWQFESSNAGTQVNTASAGTFTSGTFHTLGFFFDPEDGTTGGITPFLDGAVGTKQAITLSGLADEMSWVAGVKNGGANVETLKVDYVHVCGVR